MSESAKEREGCQAAELRIALCCDLFGPLETMRLLGYARAMRENCSLLSGRAGTEKIC